MGDIIQAIAGASKMIGNQVAMSAIHGTYGLKGSSGGPAGVNATGDEQKELDIMSNEVMLSALRSCGRVAVAVSEENDDAVVLRPLSEAARYAVVFDPVDGSSNIECSVSVGTIFGVFRIDDEVVAAGEAAFDPYRAVLRPGREMVAAGYVLYSTSTIFNFSVGAKEVRSFVLDPRYGGYIEDFGRSPLRLPDAPKKILSANGGNASSWDRPTAAFVEWCGRQEKPYTHRYIGSMVADVHRTMLYGGIFFYPADRKNKSGKLRLLYECSPMAYLVEAAGGSATVGGKRVLDLVPTKIHERSPIYIGCTRDVELLEHFFAAVPNEFVEQVKPDTSLPPLAAPKAASPLGEKKRIGGQFEAKAIRPTNVPSSRNADKLSTTVAAVASEGATPIHVAA